MADYTQRETDGSGGGFIMGLLAGVALGAGLGMLLAPKAGTELRGQVADQAQKFGTGASEQYRRASKSATGWAERGRDMVNQARLHRHRHRRQLQHRRRAQQGLAGPRLGSSSCGPGIINP